MPVSQQKIKVMDGFAIRPRAILIGQQVNGQPTI
jgi:hypothetical protein